MQRTIYQTPVLRQIMRFLCWIGLKLAGWKLQGKPPSEPKYVLIAVPHTTNWDFPITLAMAFVLDFEIYWMGKDSLFKGMAGPVMRWLGGIPIDRSKNNNVVDQMILQFKTHEHLVVTVPPEGTRSEVDKWKTGFYHIAYGAGVPIAQGFLDYKRKVGGFGPTFYPTGDIEKDIAEIQAFYKGISGKRSGK
ncbi:MAG: lysophospholipid acyltransferase family protein [Hahellaceae bacterium]|nr:lysophospholipid acyltransferase family protein [Hahellaceae bacterium]